ncbi:segregation and condensation protein A [Sporomusa acidovorans]|uniref:Segregation and condensation protein A n=1 Tax=Sporomusa acidovorans (strain ATCC 49682 / DSM 3132 / Mol) TaxID=1123286 RepID=A0ABZ3J3X9_SPOA4|nr:segregation/condensation protein A [Sporomusa acidovorans]OZC20326.1 segregation and condensation protein A [Sporomusa acidovorans DSM 3132]SDD37458.1 condensin subunit ScpA [Sporomusa acidovorans]
MATVSYNIKLEAFEGPLALLMHLIEKNQIDIYNIPIAEITEQYLAYLKAMEHFNIEVASEFLVMAATLLQIKSRMLLPRPVRVDAVEEDIDPRQELVERLIEYRKFKQVAGLFEKLGSERGQFITRFPQEFAKQFPLPEGLCLDDLLKAYVTLWESTIPSFAIIAPEQISVKDKMQDIITLLRNNDGSMELSKTIIRTGSRSEFIAAFLAVLELVRLKQIEVYQKRQFEPICLKLKE